MSHQLLGEIIQFEAEKTSKKHLSQCFSLVFINDSL